MYILCVCRVIFDRRAKMIIIESGVVNNIAINYRFSLVDNLPAACLLHLLYTPLYTKTVFYFNAIVYIDDNIFICVM